MRYDGLDVQVTANPRQVSRGRAMVGAGRGHPRASTRACSTISLTRASRWPSWTTICRAVTAPPTSRCFTSRCRPRPSSGGTTPCTSTGFPQFFLAHELAHQYWGQAVGLEELPRAMVQRGVRPVLRGVVRGATGDRARQFRDVLGRMRSTVLEQRGPGADRAGLPPRAHSWREPGVPGHRLQQGRARPAHAPTAGGRRAVLRSAAGVLPARRGSRRSAPTTCSACSKRSRAARSRGSSSAGSTSRTSRASRGTGRVDPADPTTVKLRFNQGSQAVVDLPVTVTLNYAGGSSGSAVVVLTEAEIRDPTPAGRAPLERVGERRFSGIGPVRPPIGPSRRAARPGRGLG